MPVNRSRDVAWRDHRNNGGWKERSCSQKERRGLQLGLGVVGQVGEREDGGEMSHPVGVAGYIDHLAESLSVAPSQTKEDEGRGEKIDLVMHLETIDRREVLERKVDPRVQYEMFNLDGI